MRLKDYLETLSHTDRANGIKSLAAAHGRPVGSIYKWLARDTHPAGDDRMSITEKWSGFRVTRFDERPDVWNIKSVVYVLERLDFVIEAKESKSVERR